MSPDRKGFKDESKGRQREAAFARWRNAILQEASNPASLAVVRARALHDSEVRNDPRLAAMIQQFAAEREAALHRAHHPADEHSHGSGLLPIPPSASTFVPHHEGLTLAEASDMAIALHRQIRHHLANFFEPEAREAIAHLESIMHRRPDVMPPQQLEQHRRRLANLATRRDKLFHHIADLGRRSVEASVRGDHEAARQALRRLSSIHTARPRVLPDEEYERMRQAIIHASDQQEHRKAAKRLIDKERRVARELKGLWSVIHGFHEASRTAPHDSDEFRRAEAEYHRAIGEVRSHDPDWLAELVLELVGFLDEMEDSPTAAQSQVDHFIESVRSALSKMTSEIEQIEREEGRPD